MNHILQTQLFNNTIQNYLVVAAIILFSIIFKKYIGKYLASIIFKLLSKSNKTTYKQAYLNLVVQPLSVFLVLLISFIALDNLTFPKAFEFVLFKVTSKLIIDALSNGILIIVFIWLCLRLIDFIADVINQNASVVNPAFEHQLLVFFKDFFKAIIVLMGVLLILHFSFHKNIGNLLTSLSLVGAAIALATKESLENLIASLIIFFDKPFSTGEIVKVHNLIGTVEKIGLRSTRIRTENKTYITVPNKQMVDSILDNLSQRTQRRVDVILNIDHQTTSQQIKTLKQTLQQHIKMQALIQQQHVYLMDVGKNWHTIAVEYYTTPQQTPEEFIQLKEKINYLIIDTLTELQIKIADTKTVI